MFSSSPRSLAWLMHKRLRGRVLLFAAALTAIAALSFAAAAIAGINVYCSNCHLNPLTAITDNSYNYWNYNEMYPADGTMPTGIYMLETNGVKYGAVNGVGFISWSSAGTGYGNGYCWNRSSSFEYLVTDCFDRA